MARRLVLIGYGLLMLLTGCNQTPSEVGAGFVPGQQFDVSYLDSLTLRTSTVMFDSIATSFTGRFLIGHHDDPKLGPITSIPVFQLTPPAFTALDKNTTTYTAVSLFLKRDRYSYYDTTQTVTFNVHRLTKEFFFYFGLRYNVDKFDIDRSAPPLGSITFSPRPNKPDSIEIFLPDSIGQKLISMAWSKDPTLFSLQNFKKYFQGIALIPDTLSSGAFLGLKPAPELRLYYRDKTIPPAQNPNRHLTFLMGGAGLYYNRMYSDRSATKLSSLKKSSDILSSSLTDHEIYIQSGTGLGMRVEIPYLRNLLYIQSNFQSTRAVLQILPVRGYTASLAYLPSKLSIDLVDARNVTLAANYLTASLFVDERGVASYSVNVTNFLNGEIATLLNNNNALLLRLPDADYRASVNRLSVGDTRNTDYFMKLTVYYITLSQ